MGLGKSFKKAFKKVAKVATLGAVGSGGWGSQAIGALSGGLVGGEGGLGGILGIGGADDAAKEQARLAQQQRDQEATLAANQAALQSNASQDNVASVITGGSALGSDTNALMRKRRQGGSLSSTLGIG